MADVDMGRFDLSLDPSPGHKPLRATTDDIQKEEQTVKRVTGQQNVRPIRAQVRVGIKLTKVFQSSSGTETFAHLFSIRYDTHHLTSL